jgi:Methyltransferase FkbM domain
VTFRGCSLDGLFDDFGLERVDLLKLDIEAREEEVLGNSRRLRDVGAVVGEFHDSGEPARREVFFSVFDGFSVTVRVGPGEHTTFVASR